MKFVLRFGLLLCACSAEKAELSDTALSPDCTDKPWKALRLGAELEWSGNGVDESEQARATELTERLFEEPGVALVFYRQLQSNRYVVQTPEQSTAFVRSGNQYLWEQELEWCQDGSSLSSIQEQLSGDNPNGVLLTDYPENDERVSFFESSETCWPELAPRIAQIFDSPNAPDMGFSLSPYARASTSSFGSHGGLDVAQSRAPLVISGPGVRPGRYLEAVNQVDIAPTVAALLGVKPIAGVDGAQRREAENLMLKWQDGQVLDSILADCAYGVADRAVMIIVDGLNSAEFLHALDAGEIPKISRIAGSQAAILSGGSIVGWPTFSLPGHVSLYTGAYQGHHGLLSNSFLDRSTGQSAVTTSLPELLIDGEALQQLMNQHLSSNVETLFEAVGRSFPGAITASVNELTVRGATLGRLVPTSAQPPPADLLQTELADAAAVFQVLQMFEAGQIPSLLGISFYVTDAAGEQRGPHSDLLRESLRNTDALIGQILDAYRDAGVFEETLFVFTADHGMGLQDPSRIFPTSAQLSGFSVHNYAQMLTFE